MKAVICMQALIESVEVVEGNVNDRFLFQNRKHFHQKHNETTK